MWCNHDLPGYLCSISTLARRFLCSVKNYSVGTIVKSILNLLTLAVLRIPLVDSFADIIRCAITLDGNPLPHDHHHAHLVREYYLQESQLMSFAQSVALAASPAGTVQL